MDDESEEEEEEVEQVEEKPKDAFVSNPAELRALAEQRRLSRRGNRPGPTPSQRNVVGNSSLKPYVFTIAMCYHQIIWV